MPNHLHGIVIITDDGGFIGAQGVGATGRSPLPAPHQPPTSRLEMELDENHPNRRRAPDQDPML